MSKRVEAKISCTNCQNKFEYTLYRSIWGEYPENRELVMKDKINVATCDKCGTATKLNYPFIYTNAKQYFAVWWEPVYDPQIDSDAQGYSQMLGQSNYLATAPRIKDWEEFKNTIIQFENGEIKGQPGQISSEMQDQMKGFVKSIEAKNKKGNGCLGVFLALIIAIPTLICTLL